MSEAEKSSVDKTEQLRRWRLVLGDPEDTENLPGLSDQDQRLQKALGELYSDAPKNKRGGLGGSAPKVARWLGDIREFFPSSVVQVIQQDAFDRLGLQQMLMEPEFLAAVEADVNLVADLISLGQAIPEKTKETARQVISKVVDELMKRLEHKTVDCLQGAVNRSTRTYNPRFNDIDWFRTITANLRHYQPDYKTVIPERLVGYGRKSRQQLQNVMLCVDQSGSMATSVVYSSIFAAVMASIPSVQTQLVVFDTEVVDMTEDLKDPVDVLFGVQLGGGTDINKALAYCDSKIEKPSDTHLVLITDLCEGGDADQMLQRAASLIRKGVNIITLLALSDEGQAWYDERMAAKMSALGSPVFACTPDQFPDLMATALKRQDISEWAARNDIALVRG